jgi:methyltransferase (TIGR00027 family)
MDEGRSSATAEGAALLRAAHQLLDDPRVLDDPLALPIVGKESERGLRSDPQRFQTPERRALRAFVALRSRYAEDQLAVAIQRGVRQYVILGSGLDTFAYRNPHGASGLAVFEVDHPATQAAKRARLLEVGISAPASLTFVPIDFERQTLADGLRRAGFETAEPAFFSWLGAIAYLTRESVMRTLDFVVSSMPGGSEIVFSYTTSRSSLAQRTAALGEPWLTLFDPPSLVDELGRMGFARAVDFGPEQANDRYFKARADGLRVRGSGRLMTARV